ncbi:MAG: hypothetical protein M3R58_11235 [Pseudomonadota bacterium]|nr:hypothetical protein [Pseudomonadota bacterium]
MKMLPTLALALMLAATNAAAQVAADDRKSTPKGAQPATPTEARKAADAKKAEARRKTEAAKKAEAAKASAAKRDAAPVMTGTPNVRVYKAGDPKVPVVRDRDGKAIPTNPDAYDVSSATKK